jgi:hypothetical protein
MEEAKETHLLPSQTLSLYKLQRFLLNPHSNGGNSRTHRSANPRAVVSEKGFGTLLHKGRFGGLIGVKLGSMPARVAKEFVGGRGMPRGEERDGGFGREREKREMTCSTRSLARLKRGAQAWAHSLE